MKQALRRLAVVLLSMAVGGAALGQSVPPALYAGLTWRLLGPFRGGRTVAVSGVPGDGATFFFGSVDGGVWKTVNAGVTWEPLFDQQPIASIGALAVAPSNPQVIYVGTGESDIRTDLASGDGVYKSTDGGKTWTNVGLRETRQISRIVVHPTDPNVVFVGALGHAYGPNPERGVFKSTDGGNTWVHALDLGSDIGVSDLSIATGNPSVLFAGAWQAHRPTWSAYGPIEGGQGGLFRTTDGGANWKRLKGNGLPDGDWGRVGVTVSPDGRRVYALLSAGKQSGLYRSDNGGDTWTLANPDSRLTSRGWYFNQPTIDPNNPDVVFVPNVALYRLAEGGTKLSIVRGAPGGDDYHQLWIDPANSSRIVLATDQGTTVSVDGGATWSSWFNQPIGQFYHVTTDNRFPYAVMGAQQDSGSAAVYSRTDHGYITPTDWFLIGGGESGWIVVDPSDDNILYATNAYGGVTRFDRRTSFSQDISPWPMPMWGTEIDGRKYRAPWTPMLVMSPTEKGTLFLGTQFVLKTTDGGLHWETISPDLTGARVQDRKPETPLNADNAKERGFGVVYSIAPSPLKPGVIWAGSDTGLLHLTTDGGKSWTDVTPKGLAKWSKIAMIEASRFDAAVAYAAVDRHRLDDRAPYLYRTRDFGKSWESIATGIGANAFLNAIREDSQRRELLFAGTELGAYVSFDDGDHWQPLQMNLPVTSVRDLVIHGDDLIVATHGRAFWVLDNITPLRQIAAGLNTDKPLLFRPAAAVRIDNDAFLGSPFPPEEPLAKNPPSGAMIDYFLPFDAGKVTLEIFTDDEKASLVRRFVSGKNREDDQPPVPIAERWLVKPQGLETTAGMHRFLWDLRWNGSGASEDLEEEDFGAPRGPRVAPGRYRVKLTVDGVPHTQDLVVSMDPRSTATAEDLREQQRVGLEIYARAQRTRRALAEIDQAKATVGKAILKGHPELKAQAQQLSAALTDIVQGDKSGTIGLQEASSGLLAALRVVESGDRAIPQQAQDVFRLSSQAASIRIAQWENLKAGPLSEFSRALKKAGLAP